MRLNTSSLYDLLFKLTCAINCHSLGIIYKELGMKGLGRHPINLLLAVLTGLAAQTASANHWYANLDAGIGATSIGQSQTLREFNTPAPGVTDTYSVNKQSNAAGMLAVGGGYQFAFPSNWLLNLGGELQYITNNSIEGTVHPLVNVAPNFDTLNFSYNVDSVLVMAKPTLIYVTSGSWYPYVTLGLGLSWNSASNYHETTPVGSTAAPGLFPYRDGTQCRFAFEPGIGVQHSLG